jgi:peptidoglycan/LPS O-acetylase OafA/YrhL
VLPWRSSLLKFVGGDRLPDTAQATSGLERMTSVEALRAFGAISVLWMHCIWLGPWDFPRGLGVWFHHGWLGVDLFLIISGFATTHAFMRGLKSSQRQPLRNYWRNRLARIYPLFLLTSVVFLCVIDTTPVLGPDRWLQIISHLTLTHGWFIGVTGAINGVTWTLTLEMQLYVCGALILLTPFGASRHYRAWIAVAAIVFFVAIAYRFSVYQRNGPDTPICLHWISQLPGLWEGFFLGVLIAKHDQLRAEAKFVDRDRRRTVWLLISGVLSSIALVALLEAFDHHYWDAWLFPTLFRSAIALAFALVVWAAVRFDRERSSLRDETMGIWHQLSTRLGSWSYGIYLWHLPVLLMLKRTPLTGSFLFLATLTMTLIFAALSFHWFEAPLMRWARAQAR